MGNSKKPAVKSLEHYRAKVKGEPFVLPIDEEKSIVIQRPTGDQVFDAEDALRNGNSREFLRAVAGDVGDELLEVISGEDFKVVQAISTDIQKHFGLGESVASST